MMMMVLMRSGVGSCGPWTSGSSLLVSEMVVLAALPTIECLLICFAHPLFSVVSSTIARGTAIALLHMMVMFTITIAAIMEMLMLM